MHLQGDNNARGSFSCRDAHEKCHDCEKADVLGFSSLFEVCIRVSCLKQLPAITWYLLMTS